MKQAIYREFRPKDFSKVLGQEHIVEILKNQIKNNNIGHAYLFSGIRGTGKTTCAKIFARAVNCLNPKDEGPCNECENCKMILEDRAFEVVEMDAASNRRIDDIREIKEKVIYPPQLLKYKVYIIDEAHMITNEGFNALLKILEEPPKHLIFILATTEIDKIPDTIVSRCQRFEFKRIDGKNIINNIEYILKNINISMQKEAIELIAELSSGAMRDALSLLDSIITLDKKEITVEDINESLGLVNLDSLFNFSKAVVENSKDEAIKIYRKLINDGKSPYNIIADLIKHFRNIMLTKSLDKDLTSLNDIQYKKYEQYKDKFSIEELVYILETLLEAIEKMKKSDMQNSIAEVLIIKICSFIDKKSILEKRIQALENIIKSSNKQLFTSENNIQNENIEQNNNTDDICKKEEDNFFENEKIESKNEDVKKTTQCDTNSKEKKDTETKNTESSEEKINLFAIKEVVKDTIFKKTISKLFEQSVKDLIYYPKENFLQIDCKEYLFKFGSYKLDEHNSFEIKDKETLDEFFNKINISKKDTLKLFANFVE